MGEFLFDRPKTKDVFFLRITCELEDLSVGIPQGSILGEVLFGIIIC